MGAGVLVVAKQQVSFFELCVEAGVLGLSVDMLEALARGEVYIDLECERVFSVDPDGQIVIGSSMRCLLIRPAAGGGYDVLIGSFSAISV